MRRGAVGSGSLSMALVLLIGGACSPRSTQPTRIVHPRPANAHPRLPHDLDGRAWDVLEPRSARLFVFLASDCPIANAYAPTLQRLDASFAPRGVEQVLVYVDQRDDVEHLREHREEYGHRARALHDRELALAHWAGVEVTPEAVLVDRLGRSHYRGRIDDLYTDLGRRRARATRHDLRDALEAWCTQRPVVLPTEPAVGCLLPLRLP